MGGWRSSSVSYRDHRWQVRARVGRAEADDRHGKRQLHLAECTGMTPAKTARRGKLISRLKLTRQQVCTCFHKLWA